MTDHTKCKHYKIAYIIDDVALLQLERIMSPVDDVIDFIVHLKDGSRIICDSAKKVSELPNSKTNPIQIVEIEAINQHEKQRITVDLRQHKIGGTVEYYISGSEQQCMAWSQQLEEWVAEIKPWYSGIAVTDFVYFNIGLLASLLLALMIFAGIYVLATGISTEDSSDDSSPTRIVINLSFPMAIVLGIGLNIIKNRLFPIATFATGYGKKRYDQLQRWRDFLGVTVLVSLLVNIAAAWISGGA